MKRRKILIIGLLLVAIPLTVTAQLGGLGGLGGIMGGGIIVHDPGNELQLILQVEKMAEEVANMIQQVKLTEQKLKLAIQQATYLPGRQGIWWTPLPKWKMTEAADSMHMNGGYLAALNFGADGHVGLSAAVEALSNPTWAQDARMKQELAFQERADGTIAHSLMVIGEARASEPQTRAALLKLQQTALSARDEENTEAAQLNVISAAATIQAQNSMTTNNAVLSTLETLAHQQALERQAHVQDLNDEMYRRYYQKSFLDAANAGTTAAIRGMRIP